MKTLYFLFLTHLLFGCSPMDGLDVKGDDTDDVPPVVLPHNKFFVAPGGNDNNPGTYTQPWGSWQKAFTRAVAGDTVYIRGGVYYPDNQDDYGVYLSRRGGTFSNPVCIFNYPGESPLLDCSTITRSSDVTGLFLERCRYMHLKGLTIKGVKQANSNVNSNGIGVENSVGIRFENCASHSNAGSGFSTYQSDTLYFINCDAYNNFDQLTAGYSGGQADGFVVSYASEKAYTHFSGCRSWFNSDDGFDCWENEGTVVFENCWSFNNGRGEGDGCGFKLGRTSESPLPEPQRILIRCMAFKNRFIGFNQNGANVKMTLYNNFAFDNDDAGFELSEHRNEITVRNNISYKNSNVASLSGSVIHDHNSWDASPPVTCTDNDFISIDTTGTSGLRQPDGSLPVIDFLRLKAGSDLVNSGIDVGLPFKGNAPDIGSFEAE